MIKRDRRYKTKMDERHGFYVSAQFRDEFTELIKASAIMLEVSETETVNDFLKYGDSHSVPPTYETRLKLALQKFVDLPALYKEIEEEESPATPRATAKEGNNG